MKKTQKKSRGGFTARGLSPAGLWLALLALLSVIVILAIKVFAFMGLFAPPNEQALNMALGIGAGVIFIGLALFALLDPQRVREILAGRQARYGSNAFIMLIAFLGIVFVVNLIAYQNPVQRDLSEDQLNTLAPETLNALEALPSPVHAIGFYTSRLSNATAEALFQNLVIWGKDKFSYEFVDPEANPLLAQQYEITRDGTIILSMGDQYEVLTYASEQELTSALVRLINPGERVVYFLSGHGEFNIEDSGQDDTYGLARQSLESKKYTVLTLNLRAENIIPDDALAVIIAGPLQPISSTESVLLEAYLDGGGAVILLEEPPLLLESANQPHPFHDYLAAEWGIAFNNDLVIDPDTNPPTYAVAYTYASHAITEKLSGVVTFFPSAHSLVALTGENGAIPSTLIQTIERAWGETDFASLETGPTYDGGSDTSGPITLAVASENNLSGARLVVIGDSDFASDTYFGQYANGDLLVNAIDWAAGQEDLLNLTPKETTTRTMIAFNNASLLLLALGLICLLPGLVLGGAIVSWISRRRRG
ncbi:MAG: hypothetical protein FJZ96_10820 [Chloroflexi bacterium]|nr:hypothetical protein [Chloroflexota bacterium]